VPDTQLDPRAAELLDLIGDRIDDVVARIVERAQAIYREAGTSAPVSDDELAVATGTLVRVALSALADQRRPTHDELATASMVGELRARQGHRARRVVARVRVAARVGMETLQEAGRTSGIDAVTTSGPHAHAVGLDR